MRKEVPVHKVLDDVQMHGEEVCQEEREIQDELLVPAIARRICTLQVQ